METFSLFTWMITIAPWRRFPCEICSLMTGGDGDQPFLRLNPGHSPWIITTVRKVRRHSPISGASVCLTGSLHFPRQMRSATWIPQPHGSYACLHSLSHWLKSIEVYSYKLKWRRLHNDETHSLYHSLNIIRVIKFRKLRWAGHVARMEGVRSAFKVVTGKPTGKRPLWRPRHRWEDNIRMDLKEIGINMRNWVDSAQDRDYWRALVNAQTSGFHKPCS